MNISHS